MVRCPKCRIKGDYYTPLATLDRDFDGDKMCEINKVECDACDFQFLVKDIYKMKHEYGFNIGFSAD